MSIVSGGLLAAPVLMRAGGVASTRPAVPAGARGPKDGDEVRWKVGRQELAVRSYSLRSLVYLGQPPKWAPEALPLGWPTPMPQDTFYPSRSGGGFFDDDSEDKKRGPVVPATYRERVQAAMRLISRAVDPPREGVSYTTMEELNGRLVIVQTPANHERIRKLLAMLERANTRRAAISVHAWWLALDKKQAAALLAAQRKMPDGTLVLDEAALARLDSQVQYRGRTVGYDSQRVFVSSGAAQNLLVSVEPIVAERSAAMRPVIRTVLWGAALEATPTLDETGRRANLDVIAAVALPLGVRARSTRNLGVLDPDIRPARKGRKAAPELRLEATGHIDLPDYLSHTLVASLRMPLDKPVLVGGMTAATSDGRPLPADKARTLYLVVALHADRPGSPLGLRP